MNQTRLQLRGHHLAIFAIEFYDDKFYAGTLPSYNRGSLNGFANEISKEDLLKNKYPRKEENKLEIRYQMSNSDDFITATYGERMRETLNLVWHILKTQPDFEIEIVEGLDSICRSECLNLTASCAEIRLDDEDQITLEAYGLEIGETYTARELIQKVLKYSQRTGFRSPRDKILSQR